MTLFLRHRPSSCLFGVRTKRKQPSRVPRGRILAGDPELLGVATANGLPIRAAAATLVPGALFTLKDLP